MLFGFYKTKRPYRALFFKEKFNWGGCFKLLFKLDPKILVKEKVTVGLTALYLRQVLIYLSVCDLDVGLKIFL